MEKHVRVEMKVHEDFVREFHVSIVDPHGLTGFSDVEDSEEPGEYDPVNEWEERFLVEGKEAAKFLSVIGGGEDPLDAIDNLLMGDDGAGILYAICRENGIRYSSDRE